MIELFMMMLSIAGSILVAKDGEKSLPFIIWTFSNIYWVGFNIAAGHYALAFQFTFFTGVNVYGIWTRDKATIKKILKRITKKLSLSID